MRPDRLRNRYSFERLEDRLAMSAEPVYDFYAAIAAPDVVQYSEDQLAALAAAVHDRTGVTSARNSYGFTGAGQTVAVIDTGIAWDHYALGHGYGENYRVVGGWDFAENDANPYDDGPAGFHGTHVAGIIGNTDARRGGVATGVDFVGLRVFNDQGQGKFEWVEQALRWVHENRNNFENPITTVNLSLGAQWNAATLPNWATLEDELKLLYDDGIFVSVAAGNDFAKYNAPGLAYPAASPYVVPVGSITDAGVFSNFSQRVPGMLTAPGHLITSTLPDWFMGGNGNPNDFGAASGTSMAAPYVAGAAVLVREAMEFVGYVGITQDTIYQHLRNTADVFYDTATQANYFSINVGRAIDALMPLDDFGNTFATAQQVTLSNDTTLTGRIGTRSDVDVFRFTAQVSGTITLDASVTGFASDIKLIGGTLQTINGQLSFRVTAGQEYGLQIGAKSGIGTYEVGINFAADAVATPAKTQWGQISLAQFDNQQIAGEAWYQITATRDGLLTLETLRSAAGNVRVELLNANEQTLVTMTTSGGVGRFDAQVSAGATYFVRVVGQASDVDFRLANLISQTGNTVNVFGTAGDDTFTFTTGTQHHLTINGVAYRFATSQVANIHFDGAGGNDNATLVGTTRSETATFTPQLTTLAGQTFRATVSGTEQIVVHGGGGQDQLSITGTSGNDLLTLAKGEATLVGGGLQWRGLNFASVVAYGGGGFDTARLMGTAGNDHFVASPTSATLSGLGYSHTVNHFAQVAAESRGGNDVAYLYDSAGNDHFAASPTTATLSGIGFANTAQGFKRVFATASQGVDTAMLLDSAGNDLFYGRADVSWMTGSGFYNSASGFDRVTATTSTGLDVAYLYDTLGDDVYLATPSYATLQDAGYENRVERFDRVYAYGSGGHDQAIFLDSAGNDTFTSRATMASMSGQGFANSAINFRSVEATATRGVDLAFFADLGQGDSVTGEQASLAITRAKLTELLVGFDFVTAKSNSRGVRSDVQAVDYLFTREDEW